MADDSTATEETVETELTPERVSEMIASGEAQLVDVRQDFEWEAGRIPGAVHIPLDSLPVRAAEIDRERPVVFGCRSGARSAMATQAFRASGFEAFNLAGGMEAWVENGLDIDPADGEVALPRPDNS
jgi:rhodanese-related sulfurtransferase